MHSSPVQLCLFDTNVLPPISEDEFRRRGGSVVRKLYKVRQSLTGGETAYVNYLNECIEKVRAVSRLSVNQREELILYSIERSGSTTVTEIVEDTKLDKKSVIDILTKLGTGDRAVLYSARKYTPGMPKPHYLIKSRRIKSPEAK